VVKALTASMIADSMLIEISLLHALAEVHVRDGQREKRDRYDNPKQVLHR